MEKMDEYDSLLGKYDARLGNIGTEVGQHKSQLDKLSATLASVLNELKLVKAENKALREK
jgi:archaellum component FlaC